MVVEIAYSPGVNRYNWKLYDGPDGIDFYHGSESSLGECFEKIVKYRTYISLEYAKENVMRTPEQLVHSITQHPRDAL